jgi:amidase
MKRILTLLLLGLTVAGLLTSAQGQRNVAGSRGTRRAFTVVEASIPEMQAALKRGQITSRELVLQYLTRIATYEDKLNAVMTVNRNALAEAETLDRERAQGRVRGPLHGIPIALKDNIHTTNMPTTGGALAFDGFMPPYEATVTRNLRDAGAVILAKTTMTELANWVAGAPTPMPGNYSALAGYGMNPYDPRRDPREATGDGRPALSPVGSSSGIGTAANFWAANVGTETSGSILSPANANMLAAIKPTVGRISRYGIIPITADQDTAGPMAKTVADAAILLGAMESAAPDPNDAATNKCAPPPGRDYTRFLRADGLQGARIGIPRAFYYDPANVAGALGPAGGLNADQKRVMDEAIAVLKQRGAVIVDPADIPSVIAPSAIANDPQRNLLGWNICSGAEDAKGKDADCSTVLKYGMKRDFNRWLASLGPSAPVKSLTELREFNLAHTAAGAIKYGQWDLDNSDEMDVERDRARYEADRAKDILLAATQGIDAALREHRLDALLFPANRGANIAARPGYPTVIVPFGMVPNAPIPPFPAGFNAKPAPFAVSFTGTACSEPRLIELAYAFEQATKRRVAPPAAP